MSSACASVVSPALARRQWRTPGQSRGAFQQRPFVKPRARSSNRVGGAMPISAEHWADGEIRYFVRKDTENPPPKGGILFVGSSIFREWRENRDFDADFAPLPVLNRAFGGSQAGGRARGIGGPATAMAIHASASSRYTDVRARRALVWWQVSCHPPVASRTTCEGGRGEEILSRVKYFFRCGHNNEKLTDKIMRCLPRGRGKKRSSLCFRRATSWSAWSRSSFRTSQSS